jgi:hypothetical protein
MIETIQETLELLLANNDAMRVIVDKAIADRDRYKAALESVVKQATAIEPLTVEAGARVRRIAHGIKHTADRALKGAE